MRLGVEHILTGVKSSPTDRGSVPVASVDMAVKLSSGQNCFLSSFSRFFADLCYLWRG
jgi:hypothetical protein